MHKQSRKVKGTIPPVIAIKAPPVNAAAPMVPPCFQLAHEPFVDWVPFSDSSSFIRSIAEQTTMVSMAS